MRTNSLMTAGQASLLANLALGRSSAATGDRLLGYRQIVKSSDPRAPKADVTNAPELFGDRSGSRLGNVLHPSLNPSTNIAAWRALVGDSYGDAVYGDAVYGDVEDGDVDDYGDIEDGDIYYGDAADEYGDTYDPFQMGGPKIGRAFRSQPKWLRMAEIGAAGLGGAYALAKGVKAIKKANKARKTRAAMRAVNKYSGKTTIANSMASRKYLGKIPRNMALPFFSLIGGYLQQSPISAAESFPADMLKQILDRQNMDTPFEVEVNQGVSGTPWTVSSVGPTAPAYRYYYMVSINIGVNTFNFVPGTVISLTGSMPCINGTLSISSQPFAFTLGDVRDKMAYMTFQIYPWTIVTNKALPVLGIFNSTNIITFSIAGVPTAANGGNCVMVIPGSQHTATIGLRNRLAS